MEPETWITCAPAARNAATAAAPGEELAAYLGKGDTFDCAVADFSRAYADQNGDDTAVSLTPVANLYINDGGAGLAVSASAASSMRLAPRQWATNSAWAGLPSGAAGAGKLFCAKT